MAILLKLREIIIQYNPTEREEWLSGTLPQRLAKKYPILFDKDDLRLALSQPNYHFFEWFAAIYWYNRGWRVLVEQYAYKPHNRKRKIIEKILGDKIEEILKRGVQAPDLFVYKFKNRQFFFCEVKSPTDKIKEKQYIYFKQLERKLNTEVLIAKLEKTGRE